jgi:hypothetical protein
MGHLDSIPGISPSAPSERLQRNALYALSPRGLPCRVSHPYQEGAATELLPAKRNAQMSIRAVLEDIGEEDRPTEKDLRPETIPV